MLTAEIWGWESKFPPSSWAIKPKQFVERIRNEYMKKRYEAHVVNVQGKMAQDLARLLDDPLFAVNPKDGPYGIASAREKAFSRFCRVCIDAEEALPDLESELIDCYLSRNAPEKDVDDSKTIAGQITERIGNNQSVAANTCRAVATIILDFPYLSRSGGVDGKSLLALANRSLLQLGLKPLRPEYAPLLVSQQPPPRPAKILIVDDDAAEILNTAIALAGWPDVEVEWLHQQSNNLGYSSSSEEKDAVVTDLAKAIVDRQCDIVFMDQGLHGIEGHEVVKKVRGSVRSIVFVANTGGTEDELMSAGCVASARKGEKISFPI
jgi:CheY-like chemotaxis protein